MRSVRPLFLITACLCLVAVLTSCGSRAPGAAGPAAAGQKTSGTPDLSSPEPPSNNYYVADFGDTLGTIAERFGLSESALVSLNHIGNANEIYVGQRLLLPAGAVESTAVPEPIDSVKVPILLYHHIETLSEDAGSDWYNTTVTPEAFEKQMAYLAYNGYHPVKFTDLLAALEGRKALPTKPVVITFDDGWIDCYDSAFPVLQKYHMIATFFIIAGSVGSIPADQVMSWGEIEEMSKAGMEIGSHTMTHPYLTKLEPDMLASELEDSKALLEKHVAGPVEVLAYPFGLYDDNVVAQTEAAGYRAAVTIEEGLFDTSDNLLEMPRLTPSYGSNLDAFTALLGAAGTG
jgi:peptidoglycan/xylan/chitin deacetylase (PgdA/CDA1 family)